MLNKINALNLFKTVNIYNKQVDRARAGLINFDSPACFIEIKQRNILNLTRKVNSSDLTIRFHIVLFELDGLIQTETKEEFTIWNNDNYGWDLQNIIWDNIESFNTTSISTMDQNLNIFHYRDIINNKFVKQMPPSCGPISYETEFQEYIHGNLYHYISNYECHYIDNTAMRELNYLKAYKIWNFDEDQWTTPDIIWDADFGLPELSLTITV